MFFDDRMNFLKKNVKQVLIEQARSAFPEIFTDIRQVGAIPRSEAERACRAACQTVYLGDRLVLCRVLTKYLVYTDATDVSLTPHLCLDGFWEIWITQAFVRTIKPGAFCVDIGANHGYFSLLMADIAGSSGRLLAIEPNPKLSKLLSRTLEINGFQKTATVSQNAIADVNGASVNLVVPSNHGGNASIISEIFSEQTPEDETFSVETATLDELTKDWEQVDFVKIDAEGAEDAIWRGMRETIGKNPQITVVLEFAPNRYKNPRGFLQDILDADFSLRHIDDDSEIKDLTLEQCLDERLKDFWMLFLRRDK
jgi:FkbM family methyltransferase